MELHRHKAADLVHDAFSILNGSSTNGTPAHGSGLAQPRIFQYPQRIVNQWNRRSGARVYARACLSVSSTDRQPMEPTAICFPHRYKMRFWSEQQISWPL